MRKHILICDDDPLLVDLLQFRFASRGFETSIARDGREALDCVEKNPPDAIVLDAMMPVVDGLEVLRRLRAEPERATIPIIMLTARKQESDIIGALQMGANDYVVKPFIPEELVMRVVRQLGDAG